MASNREKTQVSVVLGSYNRKRFLKATIQSIRSNGISVPYEIIVVDGGSTDGSLSWLNKQKDVITIVQHNRGSSRGQPIHRRSWGYFINLGFKCAQGEFIVMISDDSLLVRGSVMNALDHYHQLSSQGSKVGAVAFYWREWPQEEQYKVGLTLGDRMFVNHGMFARKVLEEIGWVEEDLYRFYHADGDLCLRLWQLEYEVVACPGAFVEHFRHANSKVRKENLQDQESDWSTYLRKWKGVFYDPEKNNTGGWRYYDYKDPYITVRKFPRVPSYMMVLISAMERIKRKFT
jgi:glycosyltransferase involved in cell wall biosynthesis